MRVKWNINWRMVGSVAGVAAAAIAGAALIVLCSYVVVQVINARQAQRIVPTVTATLSRAEYIAASARLMERYGQLIEANTDGLRNLPNRSDQAQNVADGARAIAAAAHALQPAPDALQEYSSNLSASAGFVVCAEQLELAMKETNETIAQQAAQSCGAAAAALGWASLPIAEGGSE
jgi:hypothetical protein